MKYLKKLFESEEKEQFKDIDDYMEDHYENYLDEEETFDSLIEKLDADKIESFIGETYREIENELSEDICSHCNEHPYIDTTRAGNDWYSVISSWVENAEAPKEVEDKLQSEIDDSNWEEIIRKGIEDEPLNFFKFKNLNIYNYIEDEKESILEDYDYLDRGGDSGLMSVKTK